ncbi:MAG: c-type cytochrome, partial [Pikeienuella sp.]
MSTKAWFCTLVFFSATSAGADGASLYREHCATCHGDNLEGDPDWRTQNPDGSFRAPPH